MWNLVQCGIVIADKQERNRLRQDMSAIERDQFRTADNTKLSYDYKGKVVHKDIAADMQSECEQSPYSLKNLAS
jgi:hypothetical protein